MADDFLTCIYTFTVTCNGSDGKECPTVTKISEYTTQSQWTLIDRVHPYYIYNYTTFHFKIPVRIAKLASEEEQEALIRGVGEKLKQNISQTHYIANYIQSGNLLYETDPLDENRHIYKAYGPNLYVLSPLGQRFYDPPQGRFGDVTYKPSYYAHQRMYKDADGNSKVIYSLVAPRMNWNNITYEYEVKQSSFIETITSEQDDE